MRANGARREKLLWTGMLTLVLAVLLGIMVNVFSTVSYAATGRITARSVNIRKEPSTNSEVVGSTAAGNTVTVNSQVVGSDNMTWYQVVVDANTVGYIREDLISVSGTVPNEGGGSAPETTLPEINPSVPVTDVQPLSANVTGSEAVRVRTDAVEAADNIITQLSSGTEVTVDGYATGTDGEIWYRVAFFQDEVVVKGFVRNDYITLNGSLTPADDSTPGTPSNSSDDGNQSTGVKDFDTSYAPDDTGTNVWWLLVRADGENYQKGKYKIEDLLSRDAVIAEEYPSLNSAVKNQKIVIIVLAILLVLAVIAATLFFFRMKDVADEAYFSAVEKKTMQERSAARSERGRTAQAAPKRTTQTAGSIGKSVKPGTAARPQSGVGQRPTVAVKPTQAGNGQSKPVGQAGQPRQAAPARPAAPNGQVKQTATPQNAQARAVRPAAGQAAPARQGTVSGQTRSAASAKEGAQPQSKPQQKPVQSAAKPAQQNENWKAKNFAEDDDEFNFEFLHWDGDEK